MPAAPAAPVATPKPVASPPPSPAPAPAQHPTSQPEHRGLEDAFKALDELDATPPPPAAKPAVEPKKEPEKPASLADKKETNGDAAGGDDVELPAVRTPKELREWAKSQGRLAKTREGEIAQLQAKLTQLEQSPKQTDREEGAIKERLATLEKQLADRENEIKLVRYEQSAEYKEKYLAPWNRMQQSAFSDVKQLEVLQKNEETGELQPVRQGTADDFVRLYNLPLGAAMREAKTLFGDGAGVVMNHYQRLHDLSGSAAEAIEQYKTQAVEREKTETARSATEREAISRMWRTVNDELVKKYPQWFSPKDDDQEGNDLLQKGYQLADTFFSQREAMTPQQRVILDAQIRHRAGAFPRLVHQLKSKDSEIAALKKDLEAFKDSEPGKPKRSADGKFVGGDEYADPLAAIDALPG